MSDSGGPDYGPLLTDFYQITMAAAAWQAGLATREAQFVLSFRSNPFGGGYTVFAGLDGVRRYFERFRFGDDELRFLATIELAGRRAFSDRFLAFLGESRFTCDVDAVPEGSAVFPREPLLRVRGPLWQCQWIESAVLNAVNFQSLVATKAARIAQAARGKPILEFGLRRAQGPDGALSASRAAYLGGATATSNVLAARRFGIPLRGTHAHSWVMAFDDEERAFRAFAEAFPDATVLLVDTYASLAGVERAVRIGRELAARGHRLQGIRLDSGDFAYLSQEARRLLDAGGLTDAKITVSNELDEYLAQSLHLQDARVDVLGVGTKLVVAWDQPAMAGVYKLAGIRDEDGAWQARIKVSDQPEKTTDPGLADVYRFFDAEGRAAGDLVCVEGENPKRATRILDPIVPGRQKTIDPTWKAVPLLEPFFRAGRPVGEEPPLEVLRRRAAQSLSTLHPSIRRLEHPHVYPVGLSPRLAAQKASLLRQYRSRPNRNDPVSKGDR